MKDVTQRTIFRWIHIVFSIPILGYIYSPFDKLPDYAGPTRYVFLPAMVLTGLWMWKGHLIRRLLSKDRSEVNNSFQRVYRPGSSGRAGLNDENPCGGCSFDQRI